MLVRNLLGSGRTHGQDLAAERQRLARQGVVAVQVHRGALDLDHIEHGGLTIVAHALQLATHLHAGRELAFGDGAHQALVAGAKSVVHRQLQGGAETHGLAFERGFHLGEDVFITPVEVGQVAMVQRFALGGGHLVADGDGGVLGDVHVGVASVLQNRALSVNR